MIRVRGRLSTERANFSRASIANYLVDPSGHWEQMRDRTNEETGDESSVQHHGDSSCSCIAHTKLFVPCAHNIPKRRDPLTAIDTIVLSSLTGLV